MLTGTRPPKVARQARVSALLRNRQIHSQEELARLLHEQGTPVTQATLSRDLEELGAVRVRAGDGALVYALPGEAGGFGSEPGGVATDDPDPPPGVRCADPPRSRSEHGRGPGGRLTRVAAELLISAEASANLVVLRTPAGAAQFLASVLDHAGWPAVLGTVAGDDTVLVISRDPGGGAELAGRLRALTRRRP